jgi:hypothetical protein
MTLREGRCEIAGGWWGSGGGARGSCRGRRRGPVGFKCWARQFVVVNRRSVLLGRGSRAGGGGTSTPAQRVGQPLGWDAGRRPYGGRCGVQGPAAGRGGVPGGKDGDGGVAGASGDMRSARGAAAALQRHSRAAKLAGFQEPAAETLGKASRGLDNAFEAAAQVQSGQAYLGRQPLAAVGQPSPRGSPRAEGGPAVLGPGATRPRRSGVASALN